MAFQFFLERLLFFSALKAELLIYVEVFFFKTMVISLYYSEVIRPIYHHNKIQNLFLVDSMLALAGVHFIGKKPLLNNYQTLDRDLRRDLKNFDGFYFYPKDSSVDPVVYYFKYVNTVDIFIPEEVYRTGSVIPYLRSKFGKKFTLSRIPDQLVPGFHEFAIYPYDDVYYIDYLKYRPDKLSSNLSFRSHRVMTELLIFGMLFKFDYEGFRMESLELSMNFTNKCKHNNLIDHHRIRHIDLSIGKILQKNNMTFEHQGQFYKSMSIKELIKIFSGICISYTSVLVYMSFYFTNSKRFYSCPTIVYRSSKSSGGGFKPAFYYKVASLLKE